MASGAGLNRVYAVVLSGIGTGTGTVATPLTSYGTLGVNDSGMVLNEAMNFSRWTFSLLGGGTGYSVSCYGTIDPVAYGIWRQSFNPGQAIPGVPGSAKNSLPATSWFLLPGPSEQTGTGGIANPLTGTSPLLTVSLPLLAVRVVLTGSATPVGGVSVAVEAVP